MAGEMRCGVGAANQKYYRLYYTLLLKFQCSGTNMSSKEESCWEGKSRCESDDQDKFFERISLKLFPYTSKIGFGLRRGFPLTRNSLVYNVLQYQVNMTGIKLAMTHEDGKCDVTGRRRFEFGHLQEAICLMGIITSLFYLVCYVYLVSYRKSYHDGFYLVYETQPLVGLG
jgi:hypothetical protein